MIKTEFMELLEELDSINEACAREEMTEAIEDIDFDALTTAEQEADQLWKEIRDFEQAYRDKVKAAAQSDEAYAKLSSEVSELEKQLEELQDSYWVRTWYETAPGDWEHDDDIDEVAHAKVKDREEELKAELAKMEAELKTIRTNIESQFTVDADNLRSKKAEREKRLATSKDLKGKLAQAYADVEPEIKAVIDFLNANPEGYKDKVIWTVDPKSLAYDKNGRVTVRLYTTIGYDPDLDYDDFTEGGEMTEDSANSTAEYAAEGVGAYPEQIADELELAESDLGWYSIPDSNWELCKEAEVYATETPELTDYVSWSATYWEPGGSDWKIRGSFKAEASIYIGKKVK